MDFFGAQDRAKRFTWKLVLAYTLAVSAITIVVFIITTVMFRYPGLFPEVDTIWDQLKQPEFFVSVLSLLSIMFGSTYLRMHQLKRGGSVVAELLNGVKVNPSTRNDKEKQLLNIVDEMAIASGLPVPEVYILNEEDGINAFAAGHTPDDAVIGISKGALKRLKRDEIQAVVAHEFSHIYHGDILLNIRLIGFLTGIIRVHQIGKSFFALGGLLITYFLKLFQQKDDQDLLRFFMSMLVVFLVGFLFFFPVYSLGFVFFITIGVVFMTIGYIGLIIGKILQSSISRQREFLADASAVQYTRNPGGLVKALKKIVHTYSEGELSSERAVELNHLFFVNSCKSYMDRFFSSHPSIPERLYALAPLVAKYSMQKQQEEIIRYKNKKIQESKKEEKARNTDSTATSSIPMPPVGIPGISDTIGAMDAISSEVILAIIASLDTPQRDTALRLLSRIPDSLRDDARNPWTAEALILALMIVNQDKVIPNVVEEKGGTHLMKEVKRIISVLDADDRELHLPLAELTFPALKQMSPAQFRAFSEMMREVVRSYDGLSLFTVSLMVIVLHPLKKVFIRAREEKPLYLLKDLGAEVSLVLSALAYESGSEPEKAWAAGYQKVKDYITEPYSCMARENIKTEALENAFLKLRQTDPFSEKVVVEAVVETIVYDQTLTIAQLEILRAVLDSLGTPIPLLSAG
ncbi:M48 family metallopeptidase [Balneolaceae bacterium ANBcel3]|nr:M48 family metallopeptidase [Balneolaceae bacterium ANBcel3]